MPTHTQQSSREARAQQLARRDRSVASGNVAGASAPRATAVAATSSKSPFSTSTASTSEHALSRLDSSTGSAARSSEARGIIAKAAKTTGSIARVETRAKLGSSVRFSGAAKKKLQEDSESLSLFRSGTSKNDPGSTDPCYKEPMPSIASSDTLHLAAQLQSWLFMSSTLETNFEASEQAANKELQARSVELSAEETDIADARTRFEAERLLDFYEELMDSSTCSIVPVMVQNFLRHEDECSRATSEALRLACSRANENADITRYNALLDRIDALRQEADGLEASILSIVNADRSEACAKTNFRVSPSLRGLLSVIHENGVNPIHARSLVQCSKDSLRIALRNWNTELLA